MIRSAVLKLTVFYLMVLMLLSVAFSVAIYRISSREIARNFPPDRSFFRLIDPTGEFESYREQQLEMGTGNLRRNLLLLNVTTLVLGAVISYGLALRTLKPIEEAVDAQSRFTSDASHELRTPLTAMRTTLEVGLRNPKLTLKQAKELLQSSLEETKKLSALSNGLLKLTRDNGRDLPKEPVVLQDIAKQAIAHLETAAEAKSININNKLDAVRVLGDTTSLQEVISIILDNAIKYSPENTSITLSNKTTGKYTYVAISDQGPGMKAVDLLHIFERFYRADSSRSRDAAEGYGLGLPIAKAIAEAHGGSIDVKSALGKGSTFTIKLPVVQRSAA